jgi:sortase A
VTETITEAPAAQPEPAAQESLATRLMRGIGWTFIWVGLLALGFVLHQIYVTTWLAQQEQGELNEERLDYFEAVAPDIRPVIVDADGLPIADAETGEPIVRELVPSRPGAGVQQPDPFDPASSPPTVAPSRDHGEPVIYPEPTAPKGSAFAVIRIPTIDRLVDGWNVVEGVTLRQLRKGAGHMPWTPYPGQIGNAVISGHRTTWGAPFHELDKLEEGDRIEVETVVGVHVYEVRQVRIVRPSALWVTAKDGPARAGIEGGGSGAWLTLTTCHPIRSARQRLIVFAELVDGPNFDTIDWLTG